MKLLGEIRSIKNLDSDEVDKAFKLFQEYYDNVFLDIFREDLAGKDFIILLKDPLSKEILGFSTQKIFKYDFLSKEIHIIFSGDTVINPKAWGSFELPKIWGGFILTLIEKYPSIPLYWMLISSSFRTYRLLPVHFNKFYPDGTKEESLYLKELAESLGCDTFFESYDAKNGIIKAGPKTQVVKKELLQINEKRKNNPHISFFLSRNPNYFRGDELVCVAKCERKNFRSLSKRMFEQYLGSGYYSEVLTSFTPNYLIQNKGNCH